MLSFETRRSSGLRPPCSMFATPVQAFQCLYRKSMSVNRPADENRSPACASTVVVPIKDVSNGNCALLASQVVRPTRFRGVRAQ